jgi:DNA-binding MarR family transcriptional regulator
MAPKDAYPTEAGARGGEATDPHEVAAALRVSVGMLLRRMRQVPTDGDLTLPESAALARLDRGGPATAAQLAKQEQISPQSMGATLAGLHERGLIERSADPQDGRRIVLSISEAGLTALRSRRNERVEQLAAALASDFTPAEREQLAQAAPLIERLAQRI